MPEEYKVGDRLQVMMTGIPAKFRAEVIEGGTTTQPWLKITTTGNWQGRVLKPGDYIITRK